MFFCYFVANKLSLSLSNLYASDAAAIVQGRWYWVWFNVPPNTLRHIEDGFLLVKWPNQQCRSTERRKIL